jgi:predicted nucleic acid-binding protein
MRALLDTSVLLLPPERLKAATVGYGELAISVATVGEVEHGLLGAGTDWALRFQRDLAHRNMLRLFKVLPFDRAAAREYAKVCFLVRQRGRTHRRRAVDLMIAATDSAHQVPLLTANAADLRGAEALVEIVSIATE